MKRWKWFLAACLLPTASALAGAPEAARPDAGCEAAYAALPEGTLLDLLDPAAPEPRRHEALAAYRRLSTMADCPEFGYTLGQLYRHGEYLPGNLLPQDLDKARALIQPMAEAGYLPAFADLAEMEMRHANAREAMRWTQVYLHYVDRFRDPGMSADDAQYQRSAYNGNLLNRVSLIWQHAPVYLPRKLVDQDLQAYLDANDNRVARRIDEYRQGLHRRASAQDGGPIRVASRPQRCYVQQIDRVGAAAATWIVEVQPSGQMGRIVLENFVPRPEVADAMVDCLRQYVFEPFPGTQPATIRIPMVMGSTEGASISRKRRR